MYDTYTDEYIQEAFIKDCFSGQSRTRLGSWKTNAKKATNPTAADYVLDYKDFYGNELKELRVYLWTSKPAHAKIFVTHHREEGTREGTEEWSFTNFLLENGTPEERARAQESYRVFSELTPEQREQRQRAQQEADEKKRQGEIRNAHAKYICAIDIEAYMKDKGIENIEDVHPYFKNKKVGAAQGVKLSYFENVLCVMIPIFDISGNFCGVQYIKPNGDKRFSAGQRVGNINYPAALYTLCGDIADPNKRIFIVEGYATGYSVAEITGFKETVVVAFNSGNVPIVSKAIRSAYPQAKITIAADNDKKTELDGHGNAGMIAARKCTGAKIAAVPDDFAVRGGSDWNDFVCSFEGKEDGLRKAAELMNEQIKQQEAEQAKMIDDVFPDIDDVEIPQDDFIINNWISEQSLIMLYGQSGCGKSFTALDMALSIVYGRPWQGFKVKEAADVVYLAGEGLRGLKRRIKGWKQQRGVTEDKQENKHALRVDRAIQPFTEDGQRILREHLDVLMNVKKCKPKLIIIDTLNRFFDGDENSTQDATKFIQFLDVLRNQYGLAVLVVHHSGKDDAKGARGSSAFRASVDFEMEQTMRGEYNVQIVQSKAKDYEPLCISLKLQKVETGDCTEDFRGQTIPETTLVYLDENIEVSKSTRSANSDQTSSLTDEQKEWVSILCRASEVKSVKGADGNERKERDYDNIPIEKVKAVVNSKFMMTDTEIHKKLNALVLAKLIEFVGLKKHITKAEGSKSATVSFTGSIKILNSRGGSAVANTLADEEINILADKKEQEYKNAQQKQENGQQTLITEDITPEEQARAMARDALRRSRQIK